MNTWRKVSRPHYIAILPILTIAFAIALLAVCGCTRQRPFRLFRGRGTQTAGQLSEEELSGHLRAFQNVFQHNVLEAAALLNKNMPTSRTRATTLLWRVRLIQACHVVLDQDNPVVGFIDAWALSVRMSQYFQEGEGSALFGEHQDIAVRAADTIEEDIERIGRLFLDEETFAETRNNVHAFSRANPIRGTFSNTVAYATEAQEDEQNVFEAALDVPLAPFKALGGVDRGAVAIGRFTDVAADFSGIIEDLPEAARWQLLLLLLELEETEMTQSFLASMTKISESSAKLAATAEQLPEELRAQLSGLTEEIEAQQPALQATLAQAESSAALIDSAMTRVNTAADTIGHSAQSLTETGRAWESAVRTFGETFPRSEQERPPTADDSPPFDINEYRLAADAISGAASELRQLALELQGLVESKGLTDRIADVDARIHDAVRLSAVESRGLINHAVWCAAGLIMMAFVLAIVYRLVVGARTVK